MLDLLRSNSQYCEMSNCEQKSLSAAKICDVSFFLSGFLTNVIRWKLLHKTEETKSFVPFNSIFIKIVEENVCHRTASGHVGRAQAMVCFCIDLVTTLSIFKSKF